MSADRNGLAQSEVTLKTRNQRMLRLNTGGSMPAVNQSRQLTLSAYFVFVKRILMRRRSVSVDSIYGRPSQSRRCLLPGRRVLVLGSIS